MTVHKCEMGVTNDGATQEVFAGQGLRAGAGSVSAGSRCCRVGPCVEPSELQKNLDGLSPSSTVQPAVPDADSVQNRRQTHGSRIPLRQQTAHPACRSLHPVSLRPPPRRRPPLRLALARCPNLPRCKATLRLSVGPLRSFHAARLCGGLSGVQPGTSWLYNKTLGDWRTHNGVDYACKPGETVSSPVEGKVTGLETDGSWGPTVSLTDAQGRVWRLWLCFCRCAPGADRFCRQKLGKAATVSCECEQEPHIHMEVQQGNRYLDPQKLMH